MTSDLRAAIARVRESITDPCWNATWKRDLALLCDAAAERAAEPQQPFAWATFDGEGSHDLRLYEDNENYRDEYIARNGPRYVEWVIPLYAHPPLAAAPAARKCYAFNTIADCDQDECKNGCRYEIAPAPPAAHADDLASALLKVRTSLGLHRDSNDPLDEYAASVRDRAERAERDLAAARAALRALVEFNGHRDSCDFADLMDAARATLDTARAGAPDVTTNGGTDVSRTA